jgi:hypothetical protein
MPGEDECSCSSVMAQAIITDKKVIPEETKEILKVIVGKYL